MFGFFKKLFGGSSAEPVKTVSAETPKSAAANTAPAEGRILDCSDLNCPMPIVKISSLMKDVAMGEKVTVYATDPAFKADLEAWLRKTGNTLVRFDEGPKQVAVIQKQN